jgi:hypothetical protein
MLVWHPTPCWWVIMISPTTMVSDFNEVEAMDEPEELQRLATTTTTIIILVVIIIQWEY